MSKPAPRKPNHQIPEPAPMRVPKRTYQPSKAELEAEDDMPGLSRDEARTAFMRPFRFESE